MQRSMKVSRRRSLLLPGEYHSNMVYERLLTALYSDIKTRLIDSQPEAAAASGAGSAGGEKGLNVGSQQNAQASNCC